MRLRAGLCAVVLLSLLPVIHAAHRNADAYRPRLDVSDRFGYLPTGEFASTACLGFDAPVADLLWIRAVLYFGEHYDGSDEVDWYVWLYYIVDLVTDLDPKFTAPYKYGGTMLRIDPQWVDASNLLFAKGLKNNPDYWYFPFSIAMNYFFRDDLGKAAHYAQIAASLPGAPFYLANLTASMLNDSNHKEVALRFLEEEYGAAVSEKRKGAIYVKIHETRFEMACEQVDEARSRYLADTGAPVTDLEGLVPTYLREIPEDPYAVFLDDPGGCGLVIDPLDLSTTSGCFLEASRTIQERYGLGLLR